MYYNNQGSIITLHAIKSAVSTGTARLIHQNGDGRTLTSLSLDCDDMDTRDECASVWDEIWTSIPTLRQALVAAHGQ